MFVGFIKYEQPHKFRRVELVESAEFSLLVIRHPRFIVLVDGILQPVLTGSLMHRVQ